MSTLICLGSSIVNFSTEFGALIKFDTKKLQIKIFNNKQTILTEIFQYLNFSDSVRVTVFSL